jgi:hypothetical protein
VEAGVRVHGDRGVHFLNEADVGLFETTLFDSHVTYGFVSAIEPTG